MLLLSLFTLFALGNCAVDRFCPARCMQTCKNPNPKNCASSSSLPTCRCSLPGYVYASTTGKCILISECPTNLGCNGDHNAVIKEAPSGCPLTCAKPEPYPCNRLGFTVGCVCKSGYILSQKSGKCVLPNKCPGGNPCRGNTTFADCTVNCPSDNCPVDDSQAVAECLPASPCPSGCVCKYGYRRKSSTDRQCILAQNCPPVECTRPNEEWHPCPSPCFSDGCGEQRTNNNGPTVCNTFIIPSCYPQCVCKPHYARDANNVCIPEEQCPADMAK